MYQNKKLNIPLLFTFIRLIISPLALPFLLVYLLPLNILTVNIILCLLFILFVLTDFLDGYLARKYGQVTQLGKVLDPIADKFLLFSTLISLLAASKIYFYWVILFITREFLVMGLRYLSLEKGFFLSVSIWGKIKTTFQMMYLTWVIVNPYQALGLKGAFWWNSIEMLLLLIALGFTVFSAQQYFQQFLDVMGIKFLPDHTLTEE